MDIEGVNLCQKLRAIGKRNFLGREESQVALLKSHDEKRQCGSAQRSEQYKKADHA
jgi:hypothetical protein